MGSSAPRADRPLPAGSGTLALSRARRRWRRGETGRANFGPARPQHWERSSAAGQALNADCNSRLRLTQGFASGGCRSGADDPGAGLGSRPPADDEMGGDRGNADRLLRLAFDKMGAATARRGHRLVARHRRQIGWRLVRAAFQFQPVKPPACEPGLGVRAVDLRPSGDDDRALTAQTAVILQRVRARDAG